MSVYYCRNRSRPLVFWLTLKEISKIFEDRHDSEGIMMIQKEWWWFGRNDDYSEEMMKYIFIDHLAWATKTWYWQTNRLTKGLCIISVIKYLDPSLLSLAGKKSTSTLYAISEQTDRLTDQWRKILKLWPQSLKIIYEKIVIRNR